METQTRFEILMHPKEFKHEKAATGRLTHLCLVNSAIHVGVEFDLHEDVQNVIADSRNYPVLLYPGAGARNLSEHPLPAADLQGRRLVVLILDATWALARKMLRLSPSLERLPRIMFTATAPSKYVIKQQPHASCLATLEAAHELLLTLDRTGMDRYPLPRQLPELFERMQDFQLRCAADPNRTGYRHRAYGAPATRKPASGRSGARRARLFTFPDVTTNLPAPTRTN